MADIGPWYSYFAWPSCTLCLGVILAFILKGELRALLGRMRKFKDAEFDTSPQTNALPKNNPKLGADEPPSITQTIRPLADFEISIYESFKQELKALKLTDSQEIELLLRALTRERTSVGFERISRIIYGTQLSCLLQAKALADGITLERARAFFDQAAEAFKSINFTFDDWLEFLLKSNLLSRENDHLKITQAGHAFLQRLLDTNDTGIRQY